MDMRDLDTYVTDTLDITPASSLDAALERWAMRRPDAPFVVEAETGRAATYAEFASAVRALRRQWGVGSRAIAVSLPGGIPAALVWIAALTGGHRLIPCAPDAPRSERERLGRAQRPDMLAVERPEDAPAFARPAARAWTSTELIALVADASCRASSAPTGDPRPRGGTLRLTTSGTTGEPKGIVLTAQQLAYTADQVRLAHGLTPEDRGLCVLPFFHINAPVVSLCATLLAGGTIVIAPRFSRRRFWEWVERERITWASVVPTIVALLLSTERPAFLPGALRFVRTASAPLPVAHHLAFEERFGIPVVETYGLSEAASQVAANPIPPARRKPGAVGLPTGVELRICRPVEPGETRALRDVAPGAAGEICIRGPNVISSYEHGASGDAFRDGWFRTGDLGYRDADGYLFITGRLREVINRGGENVAPREVEEVLLAHPDVADAAVVGEPHPLYGQRVVAYVVPRRGRKARRAADLRAYCAAHLSAFKVPEAFYTVDALPRNGNGKLARRQLTGAVEVAAAGA